MKAEILCVGSELLLGETINSNAAYVSKKLSELGIDCLFHTCVGDNEKRIHAALQVALNRSDLIITTGGLGPTTDDLTIQAIADYFHEAMIEDPHSVTCIKSFFEKLNRSMPIINLKQALRPRDARPIDNPVGTAPGMIWEIKKEKYKDLNADKIIMSFPGVPVELYGMWEETAENYLLKYAQGLLLTRHLKFINIPEAVLGEKVADILEQSNPTVAPLVSKGEPFLRVAAKAATREEAIALIEKTQKDILDRVGEFYYASDEENLEHIVGRLLTSKKLTVSTAESCTGGLVSSRLTDVSGSSDYILLNLVTYSNEAKIKMLGVSESTLQSCGAVSSETALAMAQGVRALTGADIGLSLTGIAGPTGGSVEKPVGLVYIGLSSATKEEVHELRAPSHVGRLEMKHRFSQKALDCLRRFLLGL